MHFTTLLTAATSVLVAATRSTWAQPVDSPAQVAAKADYLDVRQPVPLDVNVHGVYVRHLDSIADVVEQRIDRGERPLRVGRRLSRKHGRVRARHYGQQTQAPDASVADDSQVEAATTMYTTITTRIPIVTVYTTITTSLPPTEPTDAPTDSSSSEEPAPTDSSSDSAPTDSSTDSPAPTDSPSPTDETPSSTSSSAAPTLSNGVNPPQHSRGAVIQADGSPCGAPNGVPDPAPTSGANGDENWLNCGVDTDSGWVPPPIYLSNLIYRDLSEVLNESGNPFEACRPYLDMFQQMSDETSVPTIFFASIALQESGCNPTVTGGAGEIGMMQITSEKCPQDGSDCYDAMTNIRIGAEYFKTVLDSNDGNLAETMGEYNGWRRGLTVQQANNYAICAQHNNLDYLQNVFNGYLQGVDPSSIGMGIYHNTC